MKLYKITFTVTEERFVVADSVAEALRMAAHISPDFDDPADVEAEAVTPESEDQQVLLDGVDDDFTIADFIALGHRTPRPGELKEIEAKRAEEWLATAPKTIAELPAWHMNRPLDRRFVHGWGRHSFVGYGKTYVLNGHAALCVDVEVAAGGKPTPDMARAVRETMDPSRRAGIVTPADVAAWLAGADQILVGVDAFDARLARAWLGTAVAADPCEMTVYRGGRDRSVAFEGDGWAVVIMPLHGMVSDPSLPTLPIRSDS